MALHAQKHVHYLFKWKSNFNILSLHFHSRQSGLRTNCQEVSFHQPLDSTFWCHLSVILHLLPLGSSLLARLVCYFHSCHYPTKYCKIQKFDCSTGQIKGLSNLFYSECSILQLSPLFVLPPTLPRATFLCPVIWSRRLTMFSFQHLNLFAFFSH